MNIIGDLSVTAEEENQTASYDKTYKSLPENVHRTDDEQMRPLNGSQIYFRESAGKGTLNLSS